MATILDGKQLAQQIWAEVGQGAAKLKQAGGPTPCLAAVLVGDDPASQVYVRNKRRGCERSGLESRLIRLPAETSEADLLAEVGQLNADPSVHSILVQLPLPSGIDESRVLTAIDPAKDVDGLHPENMGLMMQGRPRYLPCTPHGVMQMLRRTGVETAGKHAVVIGRSDSVGKPMALMLAARGADATVTLAHSRTADLADVCRRADLLVAAVGRARMVRGDWIKPGAAVVDVGINRLPEAEGGGLVGDVDYAAAAERAGWITPVPGGVGPMTVAMVLVNTLRAAGGEMP